MAVYCSSHWEDHSLSPEEFSTKLFCCDIYPQDFYYWATSSASLGLAELLLLAGLWSEKPPLFLCLLLFTWRDTIRTRTDAVFSWTLCTMAWVIISDFFPFSPSLRWHVSVLKAARRMRPSALSWPTGAAAAGATSFPVSVTECHSPVCGEGAGRGGSRERPPSLCIKCLGCSHCLLGRQTSQLG